VCSVEVQPNYFLHGIWLLQALNTSMLRSHKVIGPHLAKDL